MTETLAMQMTYEVNGVVVFDKTQIMKKAWELFKKGTRKTLSSALKLVWREIKKVVKRMEMKIAWFARRDAEATAKTAKVEAINIEREAQRKAYNAEVKTKLVNMTTEEKTAMEGTVAQFSKSSFSNRGTQRIMGRVI